IFNTDLDTTGTELVVANTGASILMSYGLDSDGNIDSVDYTTVTASAVTLSSIKVLEVQGHGTYAIASDVVVFTVDGTDYDVMNIADVKTLVDVAPSTSDIAFQMFVDADGYVLAMLVDFDAAGAASTTAENYAVINKNVDAIDADDAPIQKLTGFMDGVAFTKYTEDSATVGVSLGAIELWNVTVDSNGIITAATTAAVVGNSTISAISSDKTTVKVGTAWSAIANNATVYIAELSGTEYTYTLSSLSSLRLGYTIYLYETDTDTDGYDTVIFVK
ncbi:MAG TPA: hypothetical protein VFC41_03575, partial [Anaerovoracaceae bacterium]|nr:hypothetical protein [Anaerovoracaceae bacterium]